MPFNLSSKYTEPNELPDEMQKIINEIKNSPSQEDCLKKVYEIMITKYHGSRINTYTKLFNIFTYDIATLWKKKGFMHCTNINYLFRILLLKSGLFKESDIRMRWTLVWYISPHQYLQVKINKRWISIDIWARNYGIEFGDNAHGFH